MIDDEDKSTWPMVGTVWRSCSGLGKYRVIEHETEMIVYQHIAEGQIFRRYAWEWEREMKSI